MSVPHRRCKDRSMIVMIVPRNKYRPEDVCVPVPADTSIMLFGSGEQCFICGVISKGSEIIGIPFPASVANLMLYVALYDFLSPQRVCTLKQDDPILLYLERSEPPLLGEIYRHRNVRKCFRSHNGTGRIVYFSWIITALASSAIVTQLPILWLFNASIFRTASEIIYTFESLSL